MVNFSVIIPVHNVEGYLRQCLMSAVDQVVDGDEIIVVEDHSTDRSHDIAVELAEANPQIRILRPEANIGLGPARNLGMGEASSDYVLFLDSDDYYYPGALDAIRERCDTTDADLVIFDYERLYWNDRRSRNILARLFADRPDVLTLADDPELLKLLNVAWNKAYKREFLETTALTFPHGYYEDIPFTYPVMGLASSIAMLDRVCMAYRQRRGGSILRSSGERHFELIDQLERMFEIVAEHPELRPFATDFWMRGGSHVLAVLAAGESRLPASRRADFFHKSAAVLGPTAPPMFELPMTDLGLKYRLVAMNNYPAFQALKVVNGQRIRARKLKKKFGPKLRAAANAAKRTRLNESSAVFTSLWNRPPSGNPLAIYRALSEHAPHIKGTWIISKRFTDDVGSLPHVVAGSREARALCHSAKFFVNDVNFPNELVKRPGQIELQTQHGTPLKFMGLDLQAYPVAANKMSFGWLLKRVDRWDFNLSSNRYSTEVWRRAFPAVHDILEYGYPRNDALINPNHKVREETRTRLGVPEGNLAVLYTPTHRDGVGQFDLGLDAAAFIERVGDNITLLIRGHYFYDPSDRLEGLVDTGRIIDVSDDVEIEPLYLAADAMICDYSSAMFDFANLGRPIVIYGYDWDEYRSQRGTYFDIMAEPPGAAVRTMDELVDVFTSKAYDSDDARERLARFQAIFCEFDDGRAAERVIKKFFLDDEPEPPKSLHGPRPALRTWELNRPG